MTRAFSSIFNGDEEKETLYTISKRLNKKGKWNKTNIWIDFCEEQDAQTAVTQHEEFYQSDASLGGIAWKLKSPHFSISDEAAAVNMFEKVAQNIRESEVHETVKDFLSTSLPCAAVRVSQYFSLCSSMSNNEADPPHVSNLDPLPSNRDEEVQMTP